MIFIQRYFILKIYRAAFTSVMPLETNQNLPLLNYHSRLDATKMQLLKALETNDERTIRELFLREMQQKRIAVCTRVNS